MMIIVFVFVIVGIDGWDGVAIVVEWWLQGDIVNEDDLIQWETFSIAFCLLVRPLIDQPFCDFVYLPWSPLTSRLN